MFANKDTSTPPEPHWPLMLQQATHE